MCCIVCLCVCKCEQRTRVSIMNTYSILSTLVWLQRNHISYRLVWAANRTNATAQWWLALSIKHTHTKPVRTARIRLTCVRVPSIKGVQSWLINIFKCMCVCAYKCAICIEHVRVHGEIPQLMQSRAMCVFQVSVTTTSSTHTHTAHWLRNWTARARKFTCVRW